MTKSKPPTYTPAQVVRLWLSRQGLLTITKPNKLTRKSFVEHLENTGGLQVDTVNVVDRAHYITLWSRFGTFNRQLVNRWIYQDKLAYEYWGHEASILPISHLPMGRRRMLRFPPARWENASYWKHYQTSAESKRRVQKLLRQNGPLESSDFERSKRDLEQAKVLGWGSLIPKEDKRSLQLLWHAGKVAIVDRRHFRKVYDLADRYYPKTSPATLNQYFDSWLLIGLSGCGIASESHLSNYFTAPSLSAEERATVISRNLKKKRVVEVQVQGSTERYFALPEHIEALEKLPDPSGTTLICPFDSLLWQRKRAEDLMDFRYRVEIYIPEKKREYGYYVLPILHNGQFVGRLDPKLHRDRQVLEIKTLHFEPEFRPSKSFQRLLNSKLEEFAEFLGANSIELPK